MRTTLLPALLLALLASPPAPAAGDAATEAAARMQEGWSAGVDEMSPEEVDRHRAALLEPVAASGSMECLRRVIHVARERALQVATFRKRLKSIEEAEKKEAEEAKDPDAEAKKKPLTPRDIERLEFERERRRTDKEKTPGRIEREERWQGRLAEAAGVLADALPDGEFAKAAAPLLKDALGERIEGWEPFITAALGRSRKERTARMLLEAAGESLDDYRKNLVARVKPAKELDRVNGVINERVQKYLEQQAKQGNITDMYPVSLVEPYLQEKQRLDAEVGRLSSAMEAADLRRQAARKSLGSMLGGAGEEGRGRLLDILEKEALGSRDFESRCFGLLALGPCPGDRAMRFLREAAKDPMPEVVVAALDALGTRAEAEAMEILSAAVADPRWQVRASAAAGLAATGRSAAVPPLLAAMAKAEGRTVDDLQAALVLLTGRKLPAVAAAWEAWWAKEGERFRGPKDPDRGEAAGGGGEEAPGEAAGEGGGPRVSFYGIETRSERILFILDFSGSMNFAGSETDAKRRKIDVLHEEMRKTLAGLKDGSKFNIVGFAADVRVWRKGPASRDAKTAKEAMEWVEKQSVVGSTNIYDALETSFRMMGVGAGKDKSYEPAFDTIFFMTDGKPTSGKVLEPALILGEVRRWNEGRKIRVHVIGMGGKEKGGGHPGGGGGARANDLDEKFLKDLAGENLGECVIR